MRESPAANLTDNLSGNITTRMVMLGRQHYAPHFLLFEELGEKSQPPPVDLAPEQNVENA